MTLHVIGLTGGIASGKSSVLRWLQDQGCETLDADLLARQVVEPDQPAWQNIVATFGAAVLREDRTLDRKQLGEIIFRDAAAREKLNAIVHPAVVACLQQGVVHKKSGGKSFPPLILDIPLLYEVGLTTLADQVWVVYVSPEEQIRRLMQRDGIDEDAALRRLAAQWPLEQKRNLADRVIDNSGTWKETEHRLEALWHELEQSAEFLQ